MEFDEPSGSLPFRRRRCPRALRAGSVKRGWAPAAALGLFPSPAAEADGAPGFVDESFYHHSRPRWSGGTRSRMRLFRSRTQAAAAHLAARTSFLGFAKDRSARPPPLDRGRSADGRDGLSPLPAPRTLGTPSLSAPTARARVRRGFRAAGWHVPLPRVLRRLALPDVFMVLRSPLCVAVAAARPDGWSDPRRVRGGSRPSARAKGARGLASSSG